MLSARMSLGGVVTAPHHLAATAGARVLREGGNAVEAMLASAAAIAVVYPHMNSIGGDGFWVVAPAGRDPIGIRACGPAAALASIGWYVAKGDRVIPSRGPRAALTVPGAIDGWREAHALAGELGGKLPISRLLEDAIAHAEAGIPATRSQAALTRSKWGELSEVAGFAETFAPNGPPSLGETLKQPALAATLRRLAEAGLEDFYRGDLGAALGDGAEAVGSPLRRSDFEAYRARRVAPAEVDLEDGSVFNMPPPTQGPSSLMILKIFEALGGASAFAEESVGYVHALVEATKRAFILRNAALGDPERMGEAWREWLTPEAAAHEAGAIDLSRAAAWPHPTAPGDTVWLGAIDADGTAVSYIQSIYWEFGSGVVPAGTGVALQNRGASFTLSEGPNALAPGRLPFHTLNPALAQMKDGRRIVYGTMGGEGQPQTQAAIFTRHAFYGQDMQAAITAPRWLLGRTWGAETTTLKLENRFEPALVDGLRALGHDVELLPSFDDALGHAGMASIERSGLMRGATDPRADGAVACV
ncbi:MAG: gamma-glutamyltransferase family protein [Neomegalonema sp.]|nr:gamma-glutamyltransferase family protein [Neomegalonema sp.]